MIIAIYFNIAVFVQVFVGSVGYSIYCDIPTNTFTRLDGLLDLDASKSKRLSSIFSVW